MQAGSGMGRGIRVGLLAALALAAIAALALALAPSALASTTRPYQSSFPTTSPAGLGVDQQNGDVYVVDNSGFATGVVRRYDSTGAAKDFTAGPDSGTNTLGGSSPFSFSPFVPGTFGAVAVDRSGGLSDGNIYVLDFGPSFTGEVHVFSNDGTPLTTLTGSGTPAGGFAAACGLGVDQSTGDLYVGDANDFSTGRVWRYSPSSGTVAEADYSGGIAAAGPLCAAAAAQGHLYTADVFGHGDVRSYAASDFATGPPPSPSSSLIDTGVFAVAADPNGDVYVDKGDRVGVFDSTAAPLYTFGSSSDFGTDSAGVAVKGGGNAYVADRSNGQIDVFGPPITLPDVTTDEATAIGPHTATLNGTVNPDGVQLTDCHFDYGTTSAYGQTTPCVPDASSIDPNGGAQAVSADLSGLAVDTTYHVRLVAANGDGTITGGDRTFATPPPLLVTTGAVTSVNQTTATLNGSVNPLGAEVTDCHFDYGTDTSYGQTAPCAETVGSGTSAVPVHADLTGLSAATAYHFRLQAANANGTAAGSDQTLTTTGPPAATTGLVLDLTDTTATLSGHVNPDGFPTTYFFQYATQPDFSDAESVPASEDADAGSGTDPVPVAQAVSGLQPDTVYHWRLIAANSAGGDTAVAPHPFSTLPAPAPPASCPNAELRTGPSANLPDCRAYELVSPSDAQGVPVRGGVNLQSNHFDTPFASPDGARVLFETSGQTLPGFNGNGNTDAYTATRAADGWHTSLTGPNGAEAETPGSGGVSSDLLYSAWEVDSTERGSLAAYQQTLNNNYLRTPDGGFELIGQGSLGIDPAAMARWITPGASHVIFDNAPPFAVAGHEAQLEPDAPPTGTRALYDRSADGPTRVVSLLPGDETPAAGQNANYLGPSTDGSAVAFEISDGSPVGEAYKPTYVRLDNSSTVLAATGNDVPVDRTLTCNPADRPADSKQFQWLRNSAPIPGATDRAYTTVAADDGTVIQCQYFALNANAGATQTSSPGVVVGPLPAVLPPVPVFIPPPSASDTLTVGGAGGQTLTCNAGLWSGSPTFAFQWYRNGVALSGNGAGTDTYTVQAPDLATAAVFQCAITATNVGGSVTTVSSDLATSPAPDPAAPSAIFIEPLAGVTFAGLSADGGQLFYASANPGGCTDCPVPPADLFSFDTAAGTTTPITTGGGARFVNVSADGSRVYFVSTRQLAPPAGTAGADNLYLWDRATGKVGFIAVLDPGDVPDLSSNLDQLSLTNWVNKSASENNGAAQHDGAALDPSRTTPDGSVLVFESRARLTAYDNQGHVEVYRYDATADALACVSCNPSGAPPLGDAHLEVSNDQGRLLADIRSSIPNLTPDGSLIAFQTDDALLPGDSNGVQDVYAWRDGELGLISTGRSSLGSDLYAMSSEGHDIFFTTHQELVPQDHNGGSRTIYDARIDGGFPPDASPPSCLGDACQGPPSPAPSDPSPGSSGFTGPGNQGTNRGGATTPSKKKCKKKHHTRKCAKRRNAKKAAGGNR
jgi:hypothetical protein